MSTPFAIFATVVMSTRSALLESHILLTQQNLLKQTKKEAEEAERSGDPVRIKQVCGRGACNVSGFPPPLPYLLTVRSKTYWYSTTLFSLPTSAS
jgi:hypothetical protein